MSFCAPGRSNKDWTCFTVDELVAMSLAWNKTRLGKDKPINMNIKSLPSVSLDDEISIRRYLWNELRNRFEPFCGNDESCWLDSVDLGRTLRRISPQMYKIINYFTLKPKATKGKNDWLSTNEIDYVLNQYQEAFPRFKYIGCFPSDYYIISPGKFPKEILNTYDSAAIIFNLDESHQSGSHWVAVYFENGEDGILTVEYFDPTGDPPNKNIQKFLDNEYFDDAVYLENDYPHQKGNNECGMYSIYYILERLSGKTFKDFNTSRITDNDMNKFRSFLFRPYTKTFTI